MNPTAVLVDDEPNLSAHLQVKLAKVWPELDILGSAVNGRQALALIGETQPDVVFLDIQMPGLSGIQVAQALPSSCHVVFVTAHDHYAVEAFEQAAVDYLLKPVSDERLTLTVKKLRESSKAPDIDLSTLIDQLQKNPQPAFLSWLRAGLNETIELVSVADVVYFQADQKYTSIFTATSEYFIRTPIKTLEESLDPDRFWRIHRGTIVAVAEIASAKRDIRGRYTITLKSRAEQLRSSQSYSQHFKQM